MAYLYVFLGLSLSLDLQASLLFLQEFTNPWAKASLFYSIGAILVNIVIIQMLKSPEKFPIGARNRPLAVVHVVGLWLNFQGGALFYLLVLLGPIHNSENIIFINVAFLMVFIVFSMITSALIVLPFQERLRRY